MGIKAPWRLRVPMGFAFDWMGRCCTRLRVPPCGHLQHDGDDGEDDRDQDEDDDEDEEEEERATTRR